MSNIHLVAFLDILGFKKLVDDHFSGKNTNALLFLKDALANAEQFAIKFNQAYLERFNIKFSFRQFSDCVSISMPIDQNSNFSPLIVFGTFINVVRLYQFILLEDNILVRGGISTGGHFENNNMIFSEGLIKSYKIETQHALYPRVVLDKEYLQLVENILSREPEQFEAFYKIYGRSFIKDWDDEVFLSPFGFVEEIKALEKMYGTGSIRDILNVGLEANNLEVEVSKNVVKEMGNDKELVKGILDWVENYLVQSSSQEKAEVTLKYKWLRQFLLWTLNPKKSQIKFEHYFQTRQDVK